MFDLSSSLTVETDRI